MDETGIMLSMLGSIKVLVGSDDTRGYRGAHVKRTTVTAIECISADGRCLLPMIIWPAATHRSNWTTFPTPGWHYAYSESGYTDSQISFDWLRLVFDPQTKERANGKLRVLICDGFGTHETLEVLEFCFANDIVLCRLPSHTSHKLQPCDVAVFAPLKAAYRDNVERLERGGVSAIGKQHLTYLCSPARERAFTKRNILAGWSKAGLFPFNPDRVLRDLPKPVVTALDLSAEPATEPVLSPTCTVPVTPVTPVAAESVTALQNMIISYDARALDGASKDRLERHVAKLAKATQKSFAHCSMQRHRIGLLLKTNAEAKPRKEGKSIVLGRARIMSYDDLMEARKTRIEKDLERERKKGCKRGRRRGNTKVVAAESVVVDPLLCDEATAASHIQGGNSQGGAIARSPSWRAPVAQMY
ncbi:DDE-domain-containing protein [Dissoconium aciculare CBS 342.82]|uniref:DDE-domain-containing protein n=1 Tax=Dissoconium aciculare CBS 342.82 TaxID=1314786 RepID=A0A6J3LRR2_9PEZI|nr:DDE-domain-containing protein [Dissoconium aciculare CBS 342.82]KAF1818521.1 DDE-domain-containing protein [Dissoconium aciculare CBS 342.82]